MQTLHLRQPGGEEPTQALLSQAIGFFNAASRCEAHVALSPLVVNAPLTPAVVCYAFSAELYLKLLHLITTGKPITGHKLHELFAALPDSARAELAANYERQDIQRDVAAASNAFVEWRYGHEHQQLAIEPTILSSVARACHKVVKKLAPQLRVFGETHTMPV